MTAERAAARMLIEAWTKAAEEQRRWAHSPDSGLTPQSRAIFSGRSDGYQTCADTLTMVLNLLELGMAVSELHIGAEPPPEEELG